MPTNKKQPLQSPPPDRMSHDLDEVAFLLGVCRRTVERLVDSGTLPSVKIGRSRRVPRRLLDEYMENLIRNAA